MYLISRLPEILGSTEFIALSFARKTRELVDYQERLSSKVLQGGQFEVLEGNGT
jgi:hypothetical protein